MGVNDEWSPFDGVGSVDERAQGVQQDLLGFAVGVGDRGTDTAGVGAADVDVPVGPWPLGGLHAADAELPYVDHDLQWVEGGREPLLDDLLAHGPQTGQVTGRAPDAFGAV
ncbi:hypothetical protein [Streptomyces sp. KR55]|uniref:hypothetical protein n=1 Tax=Streptomyces sp. KR55 TaxID=3457425 RepID=UPI003FD4E5BD